MQENGWDGLGRQPGKQEVNVAVVDICLFNVTLTATLISLLFIQQCIIDVATLTLEIQELLV